MYGDDTNDSGTDLWPWDNAASLQDISTPFSIVIKFEARNIRIRFVFEISRILDLIFDSNEIPDSSHP